MTEPTRILIVDDDALAAAGVAAVLGTADDLAVVGIRGDGDEVANAVHELRPDVVLCDIRMPRVDGISVVRRLATNADAPRFLMMTAFDEDGIVLQALDAGAIGFVFKGEDPRRILDSVRASVNGEAPFSPRAAVEIAHWARAERNSAKRLDARAKMDELSSRERELALAVARGASDAEIATQYFIGETTVKSTLASIRTKWGVRNRTDIAVIVAHSGLD